MRSADTWTLTFHCGSRPSTRPCTCQRSRRSSALSSCAWAPVPGAPGCGSGTASSTSLPCGSPRPCWAGPGWSTTSMTTSAKTRATSASSTAWTAVRSASSVAAPLPTGCPPPAAAAPACTTWWLASAGGRPRSCTWPSRTLGRLPSRCSTTWRPPRSCPRGGRRRRARRTRRCGPDRPRGAGPGGGAEEQAAAIAGLAWLSSQAPPGRRCFHHAGASRDRYPLPPRCCRCVFSPTPPPCACRIATCSSRSCATVSAAGSPEMLAS
mmetsp:Transcript_68536/g.183455  ORF Transcript_68536/g.183455 Transcript_68536/m.183455 type:complete len:266 (+) Transcript_68536:191-988(+)